MTKTSTSKLLKDIPKYRYFGRKRYPIPEKERLRMALDKKAFASPDTSPPSKIASEQKSKRQQGHVRGFSPATLIFVSLNPIS